MQCVRDWYLHVFSPAENTMQLFMWQRDIVRVAHGIMDCFDVSLVPLLMLLSNLNFNSPGG